MAHIKYYIVLILSVVCMAAPGIGVLIYIANPCNNSMYMGIGIGILGWCLNSSMKDLRVQTRRDVEYDEFGLSKSKGKYEYLSKEERDMIDLQKTADMERLVDTVAIKKMTKRGSKEPMNDLNKLIGLQPVKEKVREMVARMEFDKDKKKKESNSMSGRHMVFYGSPGTGKTTVARIITGFLYKYGYIKQNKCIEVDGNYLKAGTDTAIKTELIVRQSFDGVLFIDEAYALMESGDGSGQQAVATLIKQMEDNRDRFILIMAGYTKEMKQLLEYNPGFQSRIKEYLVFPDYNTAEMQQIFISMAGEHNMAVSTEAFEVFDERIEKERKLSSFGNARTVRNILDEALDKHALNYIDKKINEEQKFQLQGIDISPKPKNI